MTGDSPGRSRWPTNSGGIYFGWYLLAGAAVINGLGGSVLWQGFTVFFIPVSESLNLTAWQTSLAFSLARAENGVLGPITGWALDKYGFRILMFAGTMVTGIGYIMLAGTNSYLAFMLVYLCVVSVGSSTSFMQATTAAINTWFVRMRGLAMSVNSAAFRLGGAAMIPLLSYVVLTWGWQIAAVAVGIGMLILILPLTLLFRRSPESMGLSPDGRPLIASRRTRPDGSGSVESADDAGDWTTKQALRSPQFWVLVAATTLRISVHGTIFVHFIPILVSLGEEQQTAANLLGLLSLVAVPLILVTGYLSDRVGRPIMLTGLYSMAAMSLLGLTFVEGTLPVFLALLLFAGSEAGSSLNWAIVGDLFGRKRYASIRGMMAPVYNGVLIIAPVAAGWAYDQTGSYQSVLYAGAALMMLAAVVFLALQRVVMRPAAQMTQSQ